MQFFYYFLTTLFLIICALLVLMILIQKGRGGGLAGAFGGGGGNSAFGTKTGDVLTWVTSCTFALFVILAVAMNLVANRIGNPTKTAIAPIQQPSGPTDVPISGAAPTTRP